MDNIQKAIEAKEASSNLEYDGEKRTSLGKHSNPELEYRKSHEKLINEKLGWHKINPEYFPSRGLFYPESIEIKIRPVTTTLVRHFSTLDERNPFEVDDAFNDLLNECTLITIDGKRAFFKDLLEEDRIYVILEIKEISFPSGENKLSFSARCSHCGTENEIEVKNDSFQYRDLDPLIEKYYDPGQKKFVIQTKNYGEISIKPPTIGIMQSVSKYIRKSQRENGNKKLDKSIIKILPYLATSWQGLDEKTIKDLEYKIQRYGEREFALMFKLANAATVAVKEEMITQCSSCAAEVTAPITFPGGVKALFVISDISDELL